MVSSFSDTKGNNFRSSTILSTIRRNGNQTSLFYPSFSGTKIAIITLMKKMNLIFVPLLLINMHFYNPSTVKKESGKIESASRVKMYSNKLFWVLKIRNKYDKIIKVELGPCQYMEGFAPEKGDYVQVEGSYSSAEGETILIAREITWKGRSWILRTKEGFPLWRRKGG